MKVRTAVHEDLKAIQTLYATLFAESSQLQPDYCQQAQMGETFLHVILEDANADILVAIRESRVVGFALVKEQRTPPYDSVVPHRFALLQDLVVEEGSRGMGAGTCLLDAAQAWAGERGLDYLELQVLENNEAAARLYEREGYRAVMRTMRRVTRQAPR